MLFAYNQKVNYFTFYLSSVSLDFVWTWMIRKNQFFLE